MKAMIQASLLTLIFLTSSVLASEKKAAAVEDTLEDRVKPVGSLCMSGEPCAATVVATASASSEPRSGEDVYSTKCAVCHATGAANAPKFTDSAAWAPRIAKGLDTLYSNAIQGFSTMPAKGMCMDCSDDEIKASVDYMVEGSK